MKREKREIYMTITKKILRFSFNNTVLYYIKKPTALWKVLSFVDNEKPNNTQIKRRW